MSDLQINDNGKLLKLKDLQTIVSDSNERMYEWLHNWAGLYLDVQKSQFIKDSATVPSFKFDDESGCLSTKLIVSRIWQRLISKSVLNLQLNHLIDK